MAIPRKSKSMKRRSRKTPGAPPGTLIVDPNAAKPVVTLLAYSQEGFHEEVLADLTGVKEYLHKWPVTWINVDGLGDLNLIETLGDMFNIHKLALEDILHLSQRPKVEEYDESLFIVLRMLEPSLPVKTEQLSMFLGKGFILTFQEHMGDCLDPVRKRIRDGRGRIRTMNSDYLAYCLIDAVVDAYFPLLDEFSEQIETLEIDVMSRPTQETVATIHKYKRNLLAIRRIMMPLREAVSRLLRNEHAIITETTILYLRDCYDHIVNILDTVDSYRELIGGLLDVYLSSVSNRMNEIMKVLTIIATIFIPLSFVVGLYGMNFDGSVSPWNMPELRWYFGYPVILLVLGGIVSVQLFFFWKNGWIFNKKNKKDRNEE